MIITVEQLIKELEMHDPKSVVKVDVIECKGLVAVHNRPIEQQGMIVVLKCY
jgi:hypothetical protein